MIHNLGYLISSFRGYGLPLSRLLLEGMRNVSRSSIVAVIGGYPAVGWVTEPPSVVIRHVNHNSYDYTALIDFVEHAEEYPPWSHVFLLHDTMELGPDSDRLIRQADPSLDSVAVWGGECNLALYRVDYLQRRRDAILALKNCSKLEAVQAEGFLWRQLPSERRGVYPGDIAIGEAVAVYGGAARQPVRYTGVDITKWKANWGQDWPPSVVTS